MDLNLMGSIVAMVGGLIALIYGLYRSMNGVGALYFRILTFAVGCFALGRMYEVLYVLCVGKMTELANLGQLGTVTMSLFMMTANRGSLDYMLDDRRKELRKYRLIPLVFPLLFACFGLWLILSGCKDSTGTMISGFVALVMMVTVYFEGKHLIFPDEGLNFAASMRITNASSMVFNFAAFAMLSMDVKSLSAVYFSLGVVVAIISIVIIVSADKGVRRWQA